jgi:hypothetical protein
MGSSAVKENRVSDFISSSTARLAALMTAEFGVNTRLDPFQLTDSVLEI